MGHGSRPVPYQPEVGPFTVWVRPQQTKYRSALAARAEHGGEDIYIGAIGQHQRRHHHRSPLAPVLTPFVLTIRNTNKGTKCKRNGEPQAEIERNEKHKENCKDMDSPPSKLASAH